MPQLLMRWGFQVGDVVVEVEGDRGPVFDRAPFHPVDAPTIRLRARAVERVAPPDARLVHDDIGYALYFDGARPVVTLKSESHGTPEFARLDLDAGGGGGDFVFRRDFPVDPLRYQPLGEIIVLDHLSRSGGVMVHAAAVSHAGRAALLPGRSGVGKTTIALAIDKLPGALVLTDERALLRPTPSGWVVDGTPWCGDGEFAARATVPLAALMLLEQGPEDRLLPLSPARAMAGLLGCCFLPPWSEASARATLDSLERVVREVPAFRLQNRLGGDAPRLLVDQLGQLGQLAGDRS